MISLRGLYHGIILDHSKEPQNRRVIADANYKGERHGPLCGDKLTVFLKIKDGIIKDTAFEGTGCAITVASSSMMTVALKGRTLVEARCLFDGIYHMITDTVTAPHPELGLLEVLAGVRQFPARIECAMLAWHALQLALSDQSSKALATHRFEGQKPQVQQTSLQVS